MATQSDLATHLDLSQQAVSKLKNNGIITAGAGRSGYDLDACRVAYIRHLRQGAAGRDSARAGSLEAERARLAAAQAEAQERKNALDRGELVVLADIDANMRGVLGRVMACLDHLPARLAGNDYKLRARIEKELNDARNELARTPVVSADPDSEEDGSDGE